MRILHAQRVGRVGGEPANLFLVVEPAASLSQERNAWSSDECETKLDEYGCYEL